MRIGAALPNYGPAVAAGALQRLAQHAEAAGFDSVWVSDHVIAPLAVTSRYPYDRGPTPQPADVTPLTCFYDALTTLAFLAGCTTRVRLGVSVYVLPLRNPVVTAKTVASLDALSGGRVILGVGSGWLAEEFAVLQVPFSDREARTDEYLRICKACWTQDQVRLDGPLYVAPPLRCEPKPQQRPHPPLWIGGNGTRALQRCVRLGDGWHPIDLAPGELAPKLARLRTLCHEEGRAADSITLSMRASLRFRDRDGAESSPLHGPPEKLRDLIAAYAAAGLQELVFGLRRSASLDELLRDLDRIRDLLRA